MIEGRKERFGFLFATLAALALIAVPATASAKDRNGSGIPDRWEKSHGLSLKKNQARRDQDRDGLRNKGEWKAKTNPRDRDSDNDGLSDGREVRNGGDPLDGGVADLTDGLATVTAWDPATSRLEVTLTAGGSVSGQVTEFTGIRCALPEENPVDPVDPAVRHRGPSNGHGGRLPGRPGRGPHGGFVPGWGPSVPCSIEDLAVGTPVDMVKVRFTPEGIVFRKILIGLPAEEPVVG